MDLSRCGCLFSFLILWVIVAVIIINPSQWLPSKFSPLLSAQDARRIERNGFPSFSVTSKGRSNQQFVQGKRWNGGIQIISDELPSDIPAQTDKGNEERGDVSSNVASKTEARTQLLQTENNGGPLGNIALSNKTNTPKDATARNDVPTRTYTPSRNDNRPQKTKIALFTSDATEVSNVLNEQLPSPRDSGDNVLTEANDVLNEQMPSPRDALLSSDTTQSDDVLGEQLVDLPRELLLAHKSDNETDKDGNERYFIYRCDEGLMSFCGGWADRLKGIMTGFLFSTLTGMTFKAEVLAFPCPLGNFLVPNLVNWSLPHSFHPTLDKLGTKNVTYFDLMRRGDFYDTVQFTNFSEVVGQAKFTYFKSNLDYIDGLKKSKIYEQQLSWMKNLTRDVVYAKLYATLFKPSDYLQNRLDLFLARVRPPGHKLVCAHVRMGRNPTIPNDTQLRHTPKDLPVVWEFLKNQSHSKNSKIFLMSDSNDVMEMAKNRSFADKLVFSPGRILHVEILPGKLESKERCTALEKVLFDQQVLIHCDVLMISKSGLSRYAAYVRQKDEGLFCLVGNEIVKCEMRTLKELYKVYG